MFVDTHAHLFYPNFNEDLKEVLSRAKDAGVDYILVPSTDLASAAQTVELIEKYDFLYGAVGIHPHDTEEWNDNLIEELERLASHKKIVAIGEIGLDYHYDFSPKEKQIEAFRAQIELAIKLDKPIIVHNRESDEDMMKIIRSYSGSCLRAHFHCFNGTITDAKGLISMNHFISFAGNITFKKADALIKVLEAVKIDNLLIETDSPFMTPVPYRGKRNEPAYLRLIAEKIAAVKNISLNDVGRATSLNAFRFYGIGSKPKINYTYLLGHSLYINVTNRCNADCVFCDHKGEAVICGYNLKMLKSEEADAEVYIKEIGDPKKYKEIVFCGYGEPTIRWEVVKKIAAYVKANGGKTRLDTNGHGNFINGRDITPEFKGLIDAVSISLNTSDSKQYAELMQIDEKMFDEMIRFSKQASEFVNKIIMTVVAYNSVDSEKAKRFVEDELGFIFRERPYF